MIPNGSEFIVKERIFDLKSIFTLLLLALGASMVLFSTPVEAASSCSTAPTDKGQVSATLNIPSSATYKIWSRIKASSGGNDSFILKVDGQCLTMGNSGQPVDQWEWTNNEDGVGSASLSLTAGSHDVILAGLEENVGVDRVLFLADQTCVPNGTGDNCADSNDTVVPSVSLTNPSNNSTVSATQSISATASDNVALDRVEFSVDSSVVSTDSSAPYSYNWDSNLVANGNHQIAATAYDTSGNSSSSTVTVTVANAVTAGSATISVSPASGSLDVGQQYTYVVTIDSGGDDMDTVQAHLTYDTQKLNHVSTDYSNSDFNTSAPSSDGADYIELIRTSTSTLSGSQEVARVTFEAKNSQGALSLGFDTGNTFAVLSGVQLAMTHTGGSYTVDDTSAPSTPAGLSVSSVSGSQLALSWSASTDNVAVERYVVQRDGSSVATNIQTTNYSDSNLTPGDSYDYRVQAVDAAGNSSGFSSTVTGTTGTKVGDFNFDNQVNVFDLSILISDWGTSGDGTDLNSDTVVDVFDLSIFISHWGS